MFSSETFEMISAVKIMHFVIVAWRRMTSSAAPAVSSFIERRAKVFFALLRGLHLFLLFLLAQPRRLRGDGEVPAGDGCQHGRGGKQPGHPERHAGGPAEDGQGLQGNMTPETTEDHPLPQRPKNRRFLRKNFSIFWQPRYP